MFDGQTFLDYYGILQVDPRCDEKSLEAAYHLLLKAHHPDHSEDADPAKFNDVIQAYRVLRDPRRRAEYDLFHAERCPDQWSDAASPEGTDNVALDDSDDHARILLFLYKKRRENAQNAGVIGYYIQKMLGCSEETFEFHKWYLKEKGFLVVTEQGTMAITVEGIDHVIKMSRGARAEQLLLGQSNRPA